MTGRVRHPSSHLAADPRGGKQPDGHRTFPTLAVRARRPRSRGESAEGRRKLGGGPSGEGSAPWSATHRRRCAGSTTGVLANSAWAQAFPRSTKRSRPSLSPSIGRPSRGLGLCRREVPVVARAQMARRQVPGPLRGGPQLGCFLRADLGGDGTARMEGASGRRI